MPYTAPSKLLSTQHIEYCDISPDGLERPSPTRSVSARLQNSRSYSSTSLRQSPPPLSNAGIPPGAVISPPESAPNSSDEESPRQNPGISIVDLEAAVKAIEQHKDRPTDRMGPANALGTEAQPSSSETSTRRPPPVIAIPIVKPRHLRLSKEARKISHSRSATESSILQNEEALTSSPDDSDGDSSPKPPMVRKKSGELVRPALRPASARRRPSSMPGTPTISKAVHFDSHLEHIRHFLQLDRPLAVSADTSPVDDHDTQNEFPFGNEEKNAGPSWEWELRLNNFPDVSSRTTAPVRLEKMTLSGDKNVLTGAVAVANLAFHKNVAARFTFDNWRTVSEVGAVYCHDMHPQHAHDGYDRFSFAIKLDEQANLEHKTLFVCIRYNVNGQEFWDNNSGMNYQAGFHKMPKARPIKASGAPRPALPRSRTFTGSHSGRPQTMPPLFNDTPEVGKNVPFANPFNTSKGSQLTRTPSDDIDTFGPPKRREKPSKQAFGNRYDFGASLSAAMQSKTPLDRTTLTARARSGNAENNSADQKEKRVETSPVQSSTVSDTITNGTPAKESKASLSVSTKPWLQSSGYQELVDKYCFYGSPKSVSTKQSFTVNVPREEAAKHQHHTSGTPSPPLSPGSPAPLASPTVEAPRDTRNSMRSASPSFRSSPRSSPSPMSHRYPYHQKTLQNGFMSDPQSTPIIRG